MNRHTQTDDQLLADHCDGDGYGPGDGSGLTNSGRGAGCGYDSGNGSGDGLGYGDSDGDGAGYSPGQSPAGPVPLTAMDTDLWVIWSAEQELTL